MIITVTLNPAIDQTVEVDGFKPADTNRVLAMRWDIGGKGINVARVLKELGYEPVATGFAPGARGRMIEDELTDAGIGCDFVLIPGETRTNVTILDRATHAHTVLSLGGPTVPPTAIATLRNRLGRRIRYGSWLVLAGSIPPPGSPSLYIELMELAAERGAYVALDADGPIVAAILASASRPALLKINDHELGRATRLPVETEDDVLLAARTVRAQDVPSVVVTRGVHGAVAVTPEGEFRVNAPHVDVVSAVGAGDAFLGGLLLGLVREQAWESALSLAAGAGSAVCLTPGTMLCSRPEVSRLRGEAAVEPIRERTPAGP